MVAGAARSRPFWLEPEPLFWSGSTLNILFLRDPKYDYETMTMTMDLTMGMTTESKTLC